MRIASGSSPKICGESITKISLALSRDKAAAGNDVREQNEEAVHPFNPAGSGKMGFECHYTQTIQSFTTVNNKAKFGMTQLDASKSSRH